MPAAFRLAAMTAPTGLPKPANRAPTGRGEGVIARANGLRLLGISHELLLDIYFTIHSNHKMLRFRILFALARC